VTLPAVGIVIHRDFFVLAVFSHDLRASSAFFGGDGFLAAFTARPDSVRDSI
jgi:hypothetical protein